MKASINKDNKDADLKSSNAAQNTTTDTTSSASPPSPARTLPIVEINRKYLIIPKILYFTLFCAYFTCYTFKAKFFKDVLEFSTEDYGFISSGLFVVVWFGAMFWNYIADATARMKLVVMAASLGMALVFESFLLLSLIKDDSIRRAMAIVINIMYTLFYSSLQPLMDAQVVAYLKSIPGAGKELYGRQRLWGTFGYGKL